jgi:hypothetical protein
MIGEGDAIRLTSEGLQEFHFDFQPLPIGSIWE